MPEQTIPPAQPEKIGYYLKFNALLNWVDTHVAEVDNCVDVPLSHSHLETLSKTLSQLTTENCHDVFPALDGFFFGSQTYDENYWSEVTRPEAVYTDADGYVRL
ncbi:hypothetical protein [Yersinia intermedia]|uniref:hypothetical protein n=1 Tax=Yersinia intermedia TaxID=631 RepID=UPI0022FEA4C8|nr:hypothetical protein [Yersinia intermedia]MDA5510803.1 hypothetical protein [Yersinia intermedia]